MIEKVIVGMDARAVEYEMKDARVRIRGLELEYLTDFASLVWEARQKLRSIKKNGEKEK